MEAWSPFRWSDPVAYAWRRGERARARLVPGGVGPLDALDPAPWLAPVQPQALTIARDGGRVEVCVPAGLLAWEHPLPGASVVVFQLGPARDRVTLVALAAEGDVLGVVTLQGERPSAFAALARERLELTPCDACVRPVKPTEAPLWLALGALASRLAWILSIFL
ncbi:MAG: hypothetical protein IT378_27145, partial [Sandaracinaceae bacterium]|nr:hypothetical protein [Sandaracinaceae bacterium]